MISLGLHIIMLQFDLEIKYKDGLLQMNTSRLPEISSGGPVGTTLKLDYLDER